MTKEEYEKEYFNKVDTLTAVCRTNSSWSRGEQPELEVGKTYKISHIGVLRSCTNIRLSEFGDNEYNSTCFDLYENGIALGHSHTKDPRFFAPYLRKRYRERNPFYFAEQIETIAIPAHLRSVEHEYNVKIAFLWKER